MANFGVMAGRSGEEDKDLRLDWGATRQMFQTFLHGFVLPLATCMAMVAVDQSIGALFFREYANGVPYFYRRQKEYLQDASVECEHSSQPTPY
ncbi:hypothetical protein ZWY2020_022812 [Hordeum vulgare]|nr:hypothetical protein ZWY2020_022812 [Hordeum vulgare]